MDEHHIRARTKKISGAPFHELIVDCGNAGHRIFYFITTGRRIILLLGFLKKSQKTPSAEIQRGIRYYNDFMNQ